MATEPPAPGPSGEAILSGSGKTEDQLWKYCLRKIGGGVVDVELTSFGDKDPKTGLPLANDETHQNDCLEDTRRWYSYRVGFKKLIQINLSNRQSAYLMPPDCLEVIDVWLPSFQLPTLDADQFSYTYFSTLFGQWTNPNAAPMPYSDLVQRLQYLETIGRIFSADRDWEYRTESRVLEITPAPAATGSFSVGGSMAPALVTIWTAQIDTRQLDPMELDFFKKKLYIEALKTLANIRTTFDSYQMVGGDRGLNGIDLLTTAETLEDKLEQDILNWKRPCPLIVG